MLVQLRHKALAESKDFTVALTLRIKVRAPLSPSHRQRGQSVLEDLFEAEELDDREVDRGMEALEETQTLLAGQEFEL